jgi:SAM-dependent methyltransferase
LLGDSIARDYAWKLKLFNAFAAPELKVAIASLVLRDGMRVLDAGCGTGDALPWLAEAVGSDGAVLGIELSSAHSAAARMSIPASCGPSCGVLQADLLKPPLRPASIDLIWSVNTLNHVREPVAALRTLRSIVRPGGRIALGQSSLLPEMFFAWDARLERLTLEAVRQYYRERYGLTEGDLAGVRSLIGLLLGGGLRNIAVRTYVIERVQPLSTVDEAYVLDAIFRGTWGERLRPYLRDEDRAELAHLCDPQGPAYALRRPDFHFLQTFTLAVGEVAS